MTNHKTIQKSAFGIVSGLGTGKSGTGHWWHQRVTSVAMVFLGLWLVYAFTRQIPSDYQHVLMWVQFPIHAILLLLTILIALYHGALGLQVVIEDYVHTSWIKLSLMYAMKFLASLLAMSSLISLVKIMCLPT